MQEQIKPVIVVSKCLEHEACRWNGLMIKNSTVKLLKSKVHFIPVCPEVEIGLGVPRKPIRIIKKQNVFKLIQTETGKDVSEIMLAFIDTFFSQLPPIDGFILKAHSPSCGYRDVKIYPDGLKAPPLHNKGSGFFAWAAAKRFPTKVLETETRLNDLSLRKRFIEKLFSLAQLRNGIPSASSGSKTTG